jgi:purine-binding chemotaxis protein CheW
LYGVPVLSVRDILKIDKIAHVPLAPAIVTGSISLRGHIVTVIDVRVCLGMSRPTIKPVAAIAAPGAEPVEDRAGDETSQEVDEAEAPEAEKPAVPEAAAKTQEPKEKEAKPKEAKEEIGVTVELGSTLHTLLVDDIGEVLGVSVDQKEPVPGTLEPAWRNYTDSIYRLEKGLLVVLDPAKLVDPKAAA